MHRLLLFKPKHTWYGKYIGKKMFSTFGGQMKIIAINEVKEHGKTMIKVNFAEVGAGQLFSSKEHFINWRKHFG